MLIKLPTIGMTLRLQRSISCIK